MNPYSTHLFSLDSRLAIHTREQLFVLPLEEPNIRRLAQAHFSTVRSHAIRRCSLCRNCTALTLQFTNTHTKISAWTSRHMSSANVGYKITTSPPSYSNPHNCNHSAQHRQLFFPQYSIIPHTCVRKSTRPGRLKKPATMNSRSTSPPQAKSHVSRSWPVGRVDGTSEMKLVLRDAN